MTPKGKKMDEIVCRAMQQQDIKAVSEIEKTVLDAWSYNIIEQAQIYNKCYVALVENEIAAFACFAHFGDTADLNALSVHEKQRNKGVATTLLQFAFDDLIKSGANKFWLEVRSENMPAIKLYQRLGFKQNGIRKNFYKNPKDDALLFALYKEN